MIFFHAQYIIYISTLRHFYLHVFILFCIMQCFKVNMSFKMTSSIIPLNESNLSRSSGEMDFIFKACKVTQSFCVCVVSDVEVKKAMKKSLAVEVDCLC